VSGRGDTHHAAHLSTMAQGVGYLIPLAIVGFVASREGHVLAMAAPPAVADQAP